jgi:hypothetical protein
MATEPRTPRTRRNPTPELFARVLELDAEGGPELVASELGYKRSYAVSVIRRARGGALGARGVGLGQRIGHFLEECRNAKTTPEGRVSLGALPGFPMHTNEPAIVEKAIGVYQTRAAAATSPIAELRARQRVIDLRAGLALLEAHPSSSSARATFLEHGAQWATDNGISYAAFREMGVPANVLREAGIRR